MKNNSNAISIIVPVYNAEDFLEKCLDSMREKLETDEVILIDDGSVDGSANICDEYQKNVKNVHVIHQRNAGVSEARNVGINAVTKEWIMFVDADDYLLPGWRIIVQQGIESAENSDFVVFAKDIKTGKIEKDQSICAVFGYETILGSSLNSPYSKIYRTSLIKKEQIRFSPKLINGEDMIFNANILAACSNAYAYSKSIYAYYKNMTSATNQFNSKIIETEHEFHREMRELFRNHNLIGQPWNDIEILSILNGAYAVAYRVALGGSQHEYVLKKLLDEEMYRFALGKLSWYKASIAKKKYLALWIMSHGNVSGAVRYIRLLYMVKKLYYHKNGIICII